MSIINNIMCILNHNIIKLISTKCQLKISYKLLNLFNLFRNVEEKNLMKNIILNYKKFLNSFGDNKNMQELSYYVFEFFYKYKQNLLNINEVYTFKKPLFYLYFRHYPIYLNKNYILSIYIKPENYNNHELSIINRYTKRIHWLNLSLIDIIYCDIIKKYEKNRYFITHNNDYLYGKKFIQMYCDIKNIVNPYDDLDENFDNCDDYY